MIAFERFSKNVNLLHLAYVIGNDEVVLSISNGLLKYFPNAKEDFDNYFYFTNFGTLEGFEMSIEEFYKQLINKL